MRSFRHPAVAPLVQLGPNQFVLELFHGPTLAFKDVAMQLIARLMDHVLAQRGERTTIVGATSGDTGGAAIEAFRGREQCRLCHAVPARPHLRRAAAEDDDGRPHRNVHALAIEGNFDDCQALVKAMFNDHAFRDRVALSGVNSINWARIVAQVVYYFTAAVALGAPHREVAFTVPTGNFGDIFAGYVAKRMGLPIDRLVIATNVNDILRAHARDRHLRSARRGQRHRSPSMDIQVSSNFERLLFEACGRDAASGAAADGVAGAVRTLRAAATRAGGDPRASSTPAAPTRQETAAAIRAAWREAGDLVDPHTAVALAVADRDTPAIRRSRWSCCRPRIPRNSPMRSRPPAACGRNCRPGSTI